MSERDDETNARTITVTRIFDAPRELVFTMWTDADHLARWWGPEGFSVPKARSDARPGGELLIVMRGPDGADMPLTGTYLDVVPPERLVIESRAAMPDGTPFLEAMNTVTFADLDGKTEVTVHARAVALVPEAMPALGGMLAGWNQSLQCLDDVLTGAVGRQIVLSRLIPAPCETVFDAWIRREHVERWWGPTGFSLTIDEMDVRPGGSWRFTMHGPDGVDYPNEIVYEEVAPPVRLVYRHASPGMDHPAFRTTVTFDEMMGMTALTFRGVFEAEDRDLVVETFHAVEGGDQTLDRLMELLTEAKV